MDDLRAERASSQRYVCHLNSAGIFPVQWSLKNGLHLSPPPGMAVQLLLLSPAQHCTWPKQRRKDPALQIRSFELGELRFPRHERGFGRMREAQVVMCNNLNAGMDGVSVPGLKEILISDLINMISEACSLCIGFLLLVRMEHCYPIFYNIFRLSYHSEVN